MRPAAFEYHRAASIEEALSLLAEFGEDGRPIAGGQSLVPMMNLRLARPEHLVDINSLELDKIERTGDTLSLGALVRHERYFNAPLIAEHFPAFLDAAHWIGHPTIRRHGSLGGSISHADPSAELPCVCVLHDATIVARSVNGERRIPASEFFISAYVTALEPGEMVVAVELPIPQRRQHGAFIEIAERMGDFAVIGIGAVLELDGDTVLDARIACAGAELTPVRAASAEQFLKGRQLTEEVALEAGQLFAQSADPVNDYRSSAEYRRHLIVQLTSRTLMRAMKSKA